MRAALLSLLGIRSLFETIDALRAQQDIDRAALSQAVQRLQAEQQRTRDVLHAQLDAVKCQGEIPLALHEEFAAWKRVNPVPAAPFISVVIATYNRAELLRTRSLPSVLGQTHTGFELLLIGDGCTDDTADVVAAFDDPRVTFVNLPQRSRYPAQPHLRWLSAGMPPILHGIGLARGDFITHLGDDDEYLPERLETLARCAFEQQADVLWHPFLGEDADGKWQLHDARRFAYTHVTGSTFFYRSWFKRLADYCIAPHLLREEGDWHFGRKLAHFDAVQYRCPDPLLRHFREGLQLGR